MFIEEEINKRDCKTENFELSNPKLAGLHLVVDCLYENPLLANVKYVDDFLLKITKEINMTLAIPPVAMNFPVNEYFYDKLEDILRLSNLDPAEKEQIVNNLHHKDDGNIGGKGVSGTAVWVESHCALHSWTDFKYVSLDLFSCNTFDYKKALELIKNEFQAKEINYTILKRYMNKGADINYGKF